MSLLGIPTLGQISQRTEQIPSRDLFGFQWITGEHWPSGVNPDAVFSAIRDTHLDSNSKLSDCGIVIVTPLEPGSTEKVRREVERFANRTKDWVRIPVYLNGDAEQVPTNELIVRFRSSVQSEGAETILAKYRLKILEWPSELAPNRYLVRLGAPATKASQLRSVLKALDVVQYVDINYVVVRQRDTGRH